MTQALGVALPEEYRWLETLPGRPRMIVEALKLHGVREVIGSGNNPEILRWAEETGLSKEYRHDETPWCGLFMAVVAQRALKPLPSGPLWALSWRNFGVVIPQLQASLGDVLVFRRQRGGHVGLYVGHDDDAFHVLGGNQGDAVSIARLSRGRLVAVRRPAYRAPPTGVRPYRLSAEGALSENER